MFSALRALRPTAAQTCVAIGVFFVAKAIARGFEPDVSYEMVAVYGMVSSLFWLASAGLPLFFEFARQRPEVMDGFSAIAAGATGAAVIASVPAAWHQVIASF